FDNGELRQIDVPPGRATFGNRPGGNSVEGCARRILRQLLDEPVRWAGGCEPDGGLAGLAFPELPDPPGVGGVEAVLQHCRERVLAATLELDERLCLAVECERRGLAVARG